MMNRCNKKDCRCKKLKETRVETVYAEEITKPQTRIVKCIVSYYNCLGCGNTDMRSDDPLLRNGRFGFNVVMGVLINHLPRIPNRMNADRLALLLAGLSMASDTVANILKGEGVTCMVPYKRADTAHAADAHLACG